MIFLQFGTSAAILGALEDLDVVFEVKLLEEPDDSLGARLLEPEVCLLAKIVPYLWRPKDRVYKKGFGATGGGIFTCNIPVYSNLCALLVRHVD